MVNHTKRSALLRAGYNKKWILEPLLVDRSSLESNPGLQVDQLVCGIEGEPDTFVNAAIACPTAATFLAVTQFRRGKVILLKF